MPHCIHEADERAITETWLCSGIWRREGLLQARLRVAKAAGAHSYRARRIAGPVDCGSPDKGLDPRDPHRVQPSGGATTLSTQPRGRTLSPTARTRV
jgi:hypothetical protein